MKEAANSLLKVLEEPPEFATLFLLAENPGALLPTIRSRCVTFTLAPLEAALSRCALIANDIPTLHELWGDAACYFRCNDAESLAEVIDRLQADPQRRRDYANLAYHHAREHYTAERMVDAYVGCYKQLVTAGAMAA